MPEARRLLLLITTRTYRASAFIAASRALGLALTVGSERTQALAFRHPEGHLLLDFRDPEGALERIAAFAREHPVHAVVGADDECAPLAARAASRLGVAGHSAEAVMTCRDKWAARGCLAGAGLPSPACALVPVADARPSSPVGFPCVLKPRGLAASRGVIRVDDPEGFAAAHARIARLLAGEGPPAPDDPPRDTILVERFLPGREVALEGILHDGRLDVLALFDKPDPLDGPFFEETFYVTPSRLAEGTQRRIAETAERAARALGLGPGPIHAEFRIGPGPDGDAGPDAVWPIEIAPRSIGGLCSRAVRFEGGETLEGVILRAALAEAEIPRTSPRASGVLMVPIPGAGRLRQVRGVDAARGVPGVEAVVLTLPPGSELVPLPEGSQYLGFVFAAGESPDAVEHSLREAHGRLEFEVDAPVPAGKEIRKT